MYHNNFILPACWDNVIPDQEYCRMRIGTKPKLTAAAQTDVTAEHTDFTVADAELTDLPEIIDLDARIAGYSRADFWDNLFRQKAASATLYVIVARRAGKIIGYTLGEIRSWPVRDPVCGWLYAVGVDKDHRLHKVATALMTELVERFRQKGVAAVRTVIDVDDHLLMSFFRSCGMTAGPFVELEMAIGQS
jgi:GNAT superfamily N-acetyltransferase